MGVIRKRLKDYQAVLEKEFRNQKIDYKKEVYIPIKYKGEFINKVFVDFVVKNKILLELKVTHKLGYFHVKQVLRYLQASKLKLDYNFIVYQKMGQSSEKF